jgi:hypothetical protein
MKTKVEGTKTTKKNRKNKSTLKVIKLLGRLISFFFLLFFPGIRLGACIFHDSVFLGNVN